MNIVPEGGAPLFLQGLFADIVFCCEFRSKFYADGTTQADYLLTQREPFCG